ncbi:unnamed protein product [Peronospora farinosa]|uniref:AMP-dependent synthetase/ligase domain-containing protein n=1 Tax=Peronospora farinosa TaxID=134698 RepID=A0ABN8C8J7_9STRA|nr:unnamed protein product [Peronospora farinosa]
MPSELLDRVEKWATETPTKTMLSFADDKGIVTASLTCAELNRRVQNLAWLLVASTAQQSKGLGLKSGDRVLLVYPPGLDFIVAFLACLKAGVVAVPVYPPDPRKMKKDISMFVAVTQNCQAQTALTCSMYYNVKKISAMKEKLLLSNATQWPEDLSWVVTDDLVCTKGIDPAKHWLTQSPFAESTAFLQYTSGSYVCSKGVVLSHGNLNHNLSDISSALHAGRDTIEVSWLPQYHDMGLIGSYSRHHLPQWWNGGGKQRLWVDKEALEYDGVFRVVEAHGIWNRERNGRPVVCHREKTTASTSALLTQNTGEEKPDGETGEILISVFSKAQGYYGDEMSEISAEAFARPR